MDMAVDGDPPLPRRTVRRVEREDQRSVARVGSDRPPERAIAEAADRLDLHVADRELDREPARDVGVFGTAEAQVGARVLVESRVDLVAVPERWKIAAVGSQEPDAGRHARAGRSVDDFHVDPAGRRRERLDRHAAVAAPAPIGRQAIGPDPLGSHDDRRIGANARSMSRAVVRRTSSRGRPQPTMGGDASRCSASGGGAGRAETPGRGRPPGVRRSSRRCAASGAVRVPAVMPCPGRRSRRRPRCHCRRQVSPAARGAIEPVPPARPAAR